MAKKTIFIVEDDPDISELMKIIVENEGYKVRTFLKSENVEKNAEKLKPSLIIMDLWVDGKDGSIIIKSLKHKKTTSKIPVVIVSAKNSLEKVVKRSGADGFLSKPFNIKDLSSVIKKFV